VFVQLENKGLRVVRDKLGEAAHRTLLATQGFSEGRRYWEVKIENCERGTAIFVGICKM